MRSGAAFLTAGLIFAGACRLQAAEAFIIDIDGTIGPATADYISRAIKVSEEREGACLIIRLDTPGGLLDSTKAIVQSFYASKVPTIVYVAPSGANAGSAGCFITLAGDVAAMAPNTSIGAAHPVAMGGGGEKMDDVMKQKLVNFASSYIEAIAEKRGRNVEWAKSSVTQSESITSEKALELKVIDLIADDVQDLLAKVHGRQVGEKQLNTAGAKVVEIPQLWREKLFQVLWRPEVMLILMLAAIYGIIGELSNPGAIIPGVVGVIALVLALYMAAVLPVNVTGLALIGLAIVMFVMEIFTPTHGVLTFGGIVSFFLGGLMLFDASEGMHLPLKYLIPATLLTGAFFAFIVGVGLKAQRRPVQAGRETMIGRVVPALTAIDATSGKIFIEGEYWNAVSPEPVEAGAAVRVVGFQGLTLKVKPETGQA
jgi:membrane-bound serine protease (ClpP class)